MLTAIRWLLAVSGWISMPLSARLAGLVFCTPMPVRLTSRRVATPYGGEVLQVPGGHRRLAVYHWAPAGPEHAGKILLVHGWGGLGAQWRHLIEPLRQAGFEVLAFDLPGHGRSSGWTTNLPQVVRAVEKLAQVFGPFSGVVGHSLGGNALAVALSRGLPAERIALIGALADPQRITEEFAAQLGISARVRLAMQRYFERREQMLWAECQADHTGPRIGRPALIVHDRDDAVIPYDDGLRYARKIRGARLVPTTGLGHRRILKDDGVIREVVSFLARESGQLAA
jgi:pimeloyl-ACP methyl ester carboxylesterase